MSYYDNEKSILLFRLSNELTQDYMPVYKTVYKTISIYLPLEQLY